MKVGRRQAVRLNLLALVALCFIAAPAARVHSAENRPQVKETRVGLFSRTAVVTGFYRSAAWTEKLRDVMDQINRAALSSDTATVSKLEAQVQAWKDTAQKQLAGEAPLSNIYEYLKDSWGEIGREAGVQYIVDEPIYRDPKATFVDVTPFIMKRLPAKAPSK